MSKTGSKDKVERYFFIYEFECAVEMVGLVPLAFSDCAPLVALGSPRERALYSRSSSRMRKIASEYHEIEMIM